MRLEALGVEDATPSSRGSEEAGPDLRTEYTTHLGCSHRVNLPLRALRRALSWEKYVDELTPAGQEKSVLRTGGYDESGESARPGVNYD